MCVVLSALAEACSQMMCMLQESRGAAVEERRQFPAPNVATGNLPVAVNDPGSMRLPYSVVDTGLSHVGRSHVAYQPGVQPPSGDYVKTNEHLANIQPASTGKLFTDR